MVDRYNRDKMKMTPERRSRRKKLEKVLQQISAGEMKEVEKNNNTSNVPVTEESVKVTDLDGSSPEQDPSLRKSFIRLRFSARRHKKQDKNVGYADDGGKHGRRSKDETCVWFTSNSNLLEEIESELAPKYSLTKPLEHAPITLSGYRTAARLARLSLSCPDDFHVLKIDKEEEEDGNGEKERKMKAFQVEAMVQEMKKKQSEKALTLCKNGTFEWMEGHKSLLLSDLRLEAITWEIKRLTLERGATLQDDVEPIGYLNISALWARLQGEATATSSRASGSYLIVAILRDKVSATPLLCMEDNTLQCQSTMSFKQLHKDFNIAFQIFSLLSFQADNPTKKGKTKTLFRTATHNMISALKHRPPLQRSLLSAPTHNFACVGRATLSIDHLQHHPTNKKAEVRLPIDQGNLKLTLSWGINLETKHTGFLNVLKPSLSVWRRLWMVLDGCTLQGWNYPEDVPDKPPVDFVTLGAVQQDSVQPAALDVCVRPYSFSLLLDDSTRVLYCADSLRHMKQWCQILTRTLNAFKEWKVTS